MVFRRKNSRSNELSFHHMTSQVSNKGRLADVVVVLCFFVFDCILTELSTGLTEAVAII